MHHWLWGGVNAPARNTTFSCTSVFLQCVFRSHCRRMFPVLSVSFSGLVPDESYLVATDMLPVDNKRYRYTYHRSAWLVAGRADPKPTTSGLHVHPDCPMTGRQLNRHAISFERIKLTNSTSSNTLNNKSGHVQNII